MNTLRKRFKSTIWSSNPISYQVLGICSALAITVQVEQGLVMAIALTLVLTLSNVTISLLRKLIPHRIRIVVELSVVSALVIIVDQFLQAYYYDMSKSLSVFVGLIITNCIVLGRAEAFAMANPPAASFWDGIGNGLGYGWVLIVISFFRELLGSGTTFGYQVIPQWAYNMGYENNGLMLLPPAAFIILGIIIWISKALGGASGEEN